MAAETAGTAPPPPSTDPTPGTVRTDEGPSVTAGLLGLDGLDDVKAQAVDNPDVEARRQQKRKMEHDLFFEQPNGFKAVIRDFPKVKWQGKGREYEDLKLLIRHYDKWLKALYPSNEELEDKVWKARTVLQEKKRKDDGTISDPKELLHMLRHQYKSSGGKGTKLAAEAAKAASVPGASLTDEMKKKIEEKRQMALELKRKKEQAAKPAAVDANAAAAEAMDMEAMFREEEERAKALSQAKPQQAFSAGFDDEDDPFGFGGGLDDGDFRATSSTTPAQVASKNVASSLDDPDGFRFEEDVFGFGGGLDDEPPPPPPVPVAPKPAAAVDDAVAAKIAAAKAKALAKKKEKEEEKQRLEASKAAAEVAALEAEACPVPMDEDLFEDDPFGFGGGLDL